MDLPVILSNFDKNDDEKSISINLLLETTERRATHTNHHYPNTVRKKLSNLNEKTIVNVLLCVIVKTQYIVSLSTIIIQNCYLSRSTVEIM